MKRKLYLIRHSYAEKPESKLDIDRSLTLEGQSTVRALGRHLINAAFKPSAIFCSTAARSRETAINLIEELGINAHVISYLDIIYKASVRELLGVLNGSNNTHREIVIIGHNPVITYLGEYLTNESIGNMNPAGVVTIHFDKLNWKEIAQSSGVFVSYYHPDM